MKTNQHLAPRVRGRVKLKRWSTPRAGMGMTSDGKSTGISQNLTKRSIRDLQTQIRFEKKTKNGFRRKLVNPTYVEFIMGVPRDFTKF